MPKAFSFNREFDFVRLNGLSRVTGCLSHEWDLYIVKELIDNALDADETLWNKDTKITPKIHIWMDIFIIIRKISRQLSGLMSTGFSIIHYSGKW